MVARKLYLGQRTTPHRSAWHLLSSFKRSHQRGVEQIVYHILAKDWDLPTRKWHFKGDYELYFQRVFWIILTYCCVTYIGVPSLKWVWSKKNCCGSFFWSFRWKIYLSRGKLVPLGFLIAAALLHLFTIDNAMWNCKEFLFLDKIFLKTK